MNLWRLEWLRLVRTRRLLVVVAVYVFFGLTGPLAARYLSQILDRLGSGVQIQLPPTTPADGITQFTSNASQIGLLVVVLIAASALAIDARTEMATFLRTRVASVRQILLPSYVLTTAAVIGAFVAGTLAAWYESVVLLGALSPGAMAGGMLLASLFLAFAVAATALAASLVRGVLATTGVTVVVLLVMALVGNIPPIGRWLPTTLLSAAPALLTGKDFVDFLPAAGVTIVAIFGALTLALRGMARREL